MIYFLISLTMAAGPGCLIIEHPNITARDLAQRVTEFNQIDPDAVFSIAPNFGSRREIAATTLEHWAALKQVSLRNAEPFCIYRASASVSSIRWEQELAEALYSLFSYRPAPGELKIESTRLGAGAPGRLSLGRSGLSFDPRSSQFVWRGKVVGEGPHASVQIRFRIQRTSPRVIAARPVPAGRPLVPEDFQLIEDQFHPEASVTNQLTQFPVGKVLRRSLPKGASILAQHLGESPLISPGEAVELASKAGLARITTQVIARGRARQGESVLVSGNDGKLLVRAIAVAPGKVEIESPSARKSQ